MNAQKLLKLAELKNLKTDGLLDQADKAGVTVDFDETGDFRTMTVVCDIVDVLFPAVPNKSIERPVRAQHDFYADYLSWN